MGSSVDEFFEALEKKAADGTDFVTWYGELYFELHRGTYTTQSKTKMHVRKGEFLLHDIEYFCTHASLANKDYKYPREDIDEMWEEMCLCHFHDCLPGSSIEMVYKDADQLFDKFFPRGEKLIQAALEALGVGDKEASGYQPVSLSTHGWKRNDTLYQDQEKREKLLISQSPGMGVGQVLEVLPKVKPVSITKEGDNVFIMRNARFDVKVEGGMITSLYDNKVRRELIPPGKKANQFVIMDDKPLYWQAWDVSFPNKAASTE